MNRPPARLSTNTPTPRSSPASQGSVHSSAPGHLAEIVDDRSRFADVRALKAYAGTAPITRASGKKTSVRVRRVKNDGLATVGYRWAFCALLPSPGARAHYDKRRTAGDWRAAALRNLTNKLLGCLFHCLQARMPYAEAIAFPILDEAISGRPPNSIGCLWITQRGRTLPSDRFEGY